METLKGKEARLLARQARLRRDSRRYTGGDKGVAIWEELERVDIALTLTQRLATGYFKQYKPGPPPEPPTVVINHLLTRIDSVENTGAYITATYGPRLIGALHIGLIEDMALVRSFFVAEGFQSHGVGHRMLAVADSLARHAGRAGIWLTVQATNEGARRFYERNGFHYGGRMLCSSGSLRYCKTF